METAISTSLRTEGYLYLDRTQHIPLLETAGKQLVFLRPRRFGKSLLLSTLANYYDLNREGEFAALFGDLAVGQNPTPEHNQYLILRWDFPKCRRKAIPPPLPAICLGTLMCLLNVLCRLIRFT